MKVHVNLAALSTAAYHLLVAAVPTMVLQLVALNGHLGRDAVISIAAGAAVSAWHSVFPGGVADVKTLLLKVVRFGG
jgi:hypothetical protein